MPRQATPPYRDFGSGCHGKWTGTRSAVCNRSLWRRIAGNLHQRVVQELLRLVRSTAGLPDPKFSEKVYRKLGCLLEPGGLPTEETPDEGPNAPIKTKFKIDIISGTSAGGINGIFLAKALASGGSLKELEKLWFDEGDIETLLNDRKSCAGLPIKRQTVPQSLLNSQRMYLKLLRAFDAMDQSAPPRIGYSSRLADEVDLFATTTDIEGVPVPIRLLDNVVFERRYRNAFHLRFRKEERDDFQPDNNPFLAFAARCTSSFPFAFEPMRLSDIDEALSEGNYRTKPHCRSGSSRWKKYFANYLDEVGARGTPFANRSFGDGGYLNNAPFSYAVDTLLTRQADVPVSRKLLYVEPSPAHPEEDQDGTDSDKPNAIANSLAALITIPGYQTIRNDLSRMLQRNQAASRINTTLNEIQSRLPPPPEASVCLGGVPIFGQSLLSGLLPTAGKRRH
jgi:patatin-related protein